VNEKEKEKKKKTKNCPEKAIPIGLVIFHQTVIKMEITEFKVQLVSSSEELETCQSIRHQVFVEEQMVPSDREYDGKDDEAFHALCVCSKRRQAVATGRVLLMPSNMANLGRIAVLPEFRRRGLGRRVVQELEVIAKSKGASRASLTPHYYLEEFYKGLGYARVAGDQLIHVNEQCQLITMEKILDR
jgi:predicted GNAT family N-acyltransferase